VEGGPSSFLDAKDHRAKASIRAFKGLNLSYAGLQVTRPTSRRIYFWTLTKSKTSTFVSLAFWGYLISFAGARRMRYPGLKKTGGLACQGQS